MDIDHESLYVSELIYLGNGHPVWEPNPDSLYDRVRIGDVGYSQDGNFVPLFNILPPDESNSDRPLPFPQPDFQPLRLRGNINTHRRNPLGAGVHALESSLNFSISGGVDSSASVLHGETSLSFTNQKGAALILPYEAEREDVINKGPFKKHMLDNYRSWSHFAETECQLEKGTRLVLVTGCDLAREWATATYCRTNRDIAVGGGGGVASVASARFSLIAGWSRNQAMNTRQGPPQNRRRQEHRDQEEARDRNEPLTNQCVFLRGFHVKVRFLLGPKVLKAGAGDHNPGKHGPEEEETGGLLADVTLESLSPPTQNENLIVVLLDYMLEKSNADMVIAHDSELLPYLQGEASRENLRKTLDMKSPHIKVEDGVGSLAAEYGEASEVYKKDMEQREVSAMQVVAEHARSGVIEANFPPSSRDSFPEEILFTPAVDEGTFFGTGKPMKTMDGVSRMTDDPGLGRALPTHIEVQHGEGSRSAEDSEARKSAKVSEGGRLGPKTDPKMVNSLYGNRAPLPPKPAGTNDFTGLFSFFDVQDRHVLSVQDTEAEATPHPFKRASTHDMLGFVSILIMLAWPWIFFGVVKCLKGLQMSEGLKNFVVNHPHSTTLFIAVLGKIVLLIVCFLFSFAVIRFAQEWVMSQEIATVFLISDLRHHHWPWRVKNYLLLRIVLLPMIMLGTCIAVFQVGPSSVTSLITPVEFNRTATLTGTELDFSSGASDCVEWFNRNTTIPNNCNWKAFETLEHTHCLGENQLVDVREARRARNRALLSFIEVRSKGGMHFSGPIRGVLPLGPSGLLAFNRLQTFPFKTNFVGMVSYSYTLDHQGFTTKISCSYESQSPIAFWPVPLNNHLWSYNGTCDGLADVLTDVNATATYNGNNTLGFWACKSVPPGDEEPTYYIYLRGRVNHAQAIGNITCAVSPMQSALFPVMYQSGRNIFSTKEPITTFANPHPAFIDRVMVGLAGITWEAQNVQSNLVAESDIPFGEKGFQLPAQEQNYQYLRLYEAMIQGVIEYEVTYARFIYSTIANRPHSCNRTVTGSVNYLVLGWPTEYADIGFLVPMTTVNLSSLIVLLFAMFKARRRGHYKFDPSKHDALLSASPKTEDDPPVECKIKSSMAPRGY